MARFGMLGKLVTHPGRREEFVELLMDAAKHLAGVDGSEPYVVTPRPAWRRPDRWPGSPGRGARPRASGPAGRCAAHPRATGRYAWLWTSSCVVRTPSPFITSGGCPFVQPLQGGY